jgi:hypothetical protein
MEGSQCPRDIPFLLPIPHLISPGTWIPSGKTRGISMEMTSHAKASESYSSAAKTAEAAQHIDIE